MNTFLFVKNLVQNGWFAHMTELQLKVLLAYVSHADDSGKAFPSSRTIARYNQMSEKSTPNVRAARASLVRRGWLRRLAPETGPRGRTVNPYLITLPYSPAPEVPRRRSRSPALSSTRETAGGGVAETATASAVADPATIERCRIDDEPLSSKPHTEESQGRESGKRNIDPACEQDIEAIYEAYPRRAAKVRGINAIRRAIERLDGKTGDMSPAQWLLTRVRAYRAARDRVVAADVEQAKFTPHASKWFDDERYHDDECRPVTAPSTRPGGDRPWDGSNTDHNRQPRFGIVRHGQEDR